MRRRLFPAATTALAALILVGYALELAGDGQAFCERFGFAPARPNVLAAVTSLFVHDPGSWVHILGNLAVLLVVGARVEQIIGSRRFAAVYFAGGLAGAAMHVAIDPNSLSPLVGCSASLFAVLAVAATLFGPGMLAFVAVLVAANIWHVIDAPVGEGISFAAHIGGFAIGVVIVIARGRGVRWATT